MNAMSRWDVSESQEEERLYADSNEKYLTCLEYYLQAGPRELAPFTFPSSQQASPCSPLPLPSPSLSSYSPCFLRS